jgi:hypothetical protein
MWSTLVDAGGHRQTELADRRTPLTNPTAIVPIAQVHGEGPATGAAAGGVRVQRPVQLPPGGLQEPRGGQGPPAPPRGLPVRECMHVFCFCCQLCRDRLGCDSCWLANSPALDPTDPSPFLCPFLLSLYACRCKEPGKGWGVRCLDPIPAGSFVTDYLGEILREEDAEKRGIRCVRGLRLVVGGWWNWLADRPRCSCSLLIGLDFLLIFPCSMIMCRHSKGDQYLFTLDMWATDAARWVRVCVCVCGWVHTALHSRPCC